MSLLRRRKPLSAAHKKAISDALKGKKRGGAATSRAQKSKTNTPAAKAPEAPTKFRDRQRAGTTRQQTQKAPNDGLKFRDRQRARAAAAPTVPVTDVDSVVKSEEYQAIAGKVYSRYTTLADAHKRNSGGKSWAQTKASDPGLKRLGAQAQKLLPEGYTFDPKWPESPKKAPAKRAPKR